MHTEVHYLHIHSTVQQTVWHRVLRPLAYQDEPMFGRLRSHESILTALDVPIPRMKSTYHTREERELQGADMIYLHLALQLFQCHLQPVAC